MTAFPIFRPFAEHALLVELGDRIADETQAAVLRLDRALAENPCSGFRECIPAYVNLMVRFDPLVTDHAAVKAHVQILLQHSATATPKGQTRIVDVCYDPAFAPDLPGVAQQTGLSRDEVIAAHLSGVYQVALYGFAPGYAYLSGVPQVIRLPRKSTAVRDIPPGAVIIAAGQCIVTTLTMPTGWWIIGRSPTRILDPTGPRPFLFDVGDRVQFRRVGAEAL